MWRTSFLNLPGVRPPSFPAPARDSGTLVFLVERRPRGQHTLPGRAVPAPASAAGARSGRSDGLVSLARSCVQTCEHNLMETHVAQS